MEILEAAEIAKELTKEVISDITEIQTLNLEQLKSRNDGLETPFEQIETRNQHLEGKVHPETGVPFERKVVENDQGHLVEGVFAKFESKFDAQLPENLYKETDRKQFDYANRELGENIKENKELRETFNERQLEQIKHGKTPEGFTWHHSEESGKLELVDAETHVKTGHTGGRFIWGGGTEMRA